jgi:hypothetical protein
MDIFQIFRKTLNVVWRYRALWLFGALLALTVNNTLWLAIPWDDEGVVAENHLILSDTVTLHFLGEGLTIDLRNPGVPTIEIEGLEPGWYRELSGDARLSDVRAMLISFAIVVVTCSLLALLFRYTSQAAVIRMVDENERSGEMVSLRQGMHMGWSRVAGRLFLIDLFISLPVLLVFAMLFTLAMSPLLILDLEGISENLVNVLGIAFISAIGMLLLTLLAILAAVILSITRPVMYQACAVDGLGIWASIRQGFSLLKNRFGRVMLTWLAWMAVRLGWMIALIPVVIVLFPVLLFTMLVGILIAGLPALLTTWIANQFVTPIFAWIMGVIFGLPLFALVTISPILFLSGLVETFKSSFWTLSYREFRPLSGGSVKPAE